MSYNNQDCICIITLTPHFHQPVLAAFSALASILARRGDAPLLHGAQKQKTLSYTQEYHPWRLDINDAAHVPFIVSALVVPYCIGGSRILQWEASGQEAILTRRISWTLVR